MPLRGGVSVSVLLPEEAVLAGERVRVRGRVDPTLGPVNFDIGSIEDYLRARGIHLGLSVPRENLERLGRDAWSVRHWLERLRAAEAGLLARYLPAESLPFVLAVWLGEGATLAPGEYDAFVSSGTAHVLSVSGVHVMIVYLTMNAALAGLVRRRKARAALTIAAVLVYSLVAGAHVATMRSALMLALYLGAELFDREPDAGTSLGLAAAIFLVYSPAFLFDVGFLLSFASVASMLVFNDAIAGRLPGWIGPLRGGVATSLSAQLLPFPLAAGYFHLVPIYGVIANVIVVPLLTVVLWLCVLVTTAGAVSTTFGTVFGMALHAAVQGARAIVSFFAALPGSHALLSSPTFVAVVFFWVGAWFLARALRGEGRMRRAWACVGVCGGLCAAAWSPWQQGPSVDVLDVGHGDAAFIRTPEGGTMLIDGGDRSEYVDCGRRIVTPFLLAQGVRHLDYVVSTHADRDHIGGLFDVVQRFDVGAVVMSPAAGDEPLEIDLLAACAARGIPVRRVARGDTLPIAGATVETLFPPHDYESGGSVNDRSLVLRVAWPGFSMLLTGDIEARAEQALVSLGECTAELLKVPHHGSGTSSTEALLSAVSPRIALCSTDARPNRRPIDPAVKVRYGRHGISLWQTNEAGGLRLRPRGDDWAVEGARVARGYSLAAGDAGE